MVEEITKQRLGKMGDRARLDCWIMTAQDKELNRIAESLGKSRTDCIIEALQYWINQIHKDGI
jgi:hypothetical protein